MPYTIYGDAVGNFEKQELGEGRLRRCGNVKEQALYSHKDWEKVNKGTLVLESDLGNIGSTPLQTQEDGCNVGNLRTPMRALYSWKEGRKASAYYSER